METLFSFPFLRQMLKPVKVRGGGVALLILLTRIISHSATPPFVGSLVLPPISRGSFNRASRDGLLRVSKTNETLQSDAPVCILLASIRFSVASLTGTPALES